MLLHCFYVHVSKSFIIIQDTLAIALYCYLLFLISDNDAISVDSIRY